MPELLFLMYFTFSAYISANTMSVWHLVHRKSAFSHFNLLFPLFSQIFPFCLPLSLKLSLKPELQFLVESLQLRETCSLLHLPGPNCSLAASGLHMWEGLMCWSLWEGDVPSRWECCSFILPRVEQGPGSGQMPSLALSPPEMLLSFASNACWDWK